MNKTENIQKRTQRFNLIVGALTPFHFNVFKKRFDMLSQCLVQSITKKKHFLLVVSGTTTTYSPSYEKF